MPYRSAKYLGVFCAVGGAVFLMFVAAAPLGIVRAYPLPPKEAVDGPLGASRPIDHIESIYRRPGEPQKAYFERLTRDVANGITHYWTKGDTWQPSDARYTAISPWDNYALWLMGFLPRYAHFHNYEFVEPGKAISRGYGFCSQVARIVHAVLERQHISATILENPNHMIVQADGTILDADYGVFIPHSVEWMQAHPDEVETYYRDFRYAWPALKHVYKTGWTATDVSSFPQVQAYLTRMDWLKWVPPVGLLSVGGALLVFGIRFGRP